MRVEGLKVAVKELTAAKEKMQAAASKALNRVGEGVMTEASRKVRETYNIKADKIKQSLKILYSPAEAGQVTIKSKGRSLSLSNFKLEPKNQSPKKLKTVKVAIRRGESKKIKTAFLRAGADRIRVLARKNPTGQSGLRRVKNQKGDYPELPITELYGPAVPVLLNAPEVIEHVEKEAWERMKKRMTHESKSIFKGLE